MTNQNSQWLYVSSQRQSTPRKLSKNLTPDRPYLSFSGAKIAFRVDNDPLRP